MRSTTYEVEIEVAAPTTSNGLTEFLVVTIRAPTTEDAVWGAVEDVEGAGYAVVEVLSVRGGQASSARYANPGKPTLGELEEAKKTKGGGYKPTILAPAFVGEQAAVAYNLSGPGCAPWRKGARKPIPGEPLACFTVYDRRNGTALAYTDDVLLEDVDYYVSAAGLKAVRPGGRRSGRRTVFAWVSGTVRNPARMKKLGRASDWVGFTFNPNREDSFVLRDTGEPLFHSDYAWFDSSSHAGIAFKPGTRRANPDRAILGKAQLAQLAYEIGGDLSEMGG